MWSTFPLFGSTLLLAVMVVASYTFAVSLAAGASGRARTLQAARFGAYGTVILIATCVFCLAYAFVSHDFRIRYVTHYSDRSMTTAYLLTALWGGQDGSLLWWLFLMSLYIGACVKWLGARYLELQPYIIATLMAVVLFFCVLMAFSANPFAQNISGAAADGEGLNPLLQNYWMIIHPPCLYTGFVGCTIPFAFAVAALVTGRLDNEWILACRKWAIFAWLFLAIGNTLGMVWAYEELGWGGYWAWDPVENAAFMPFLTATAFLHSVMIQERRGLLRVWNVALICMTFFMTIFGTFLTRSGAIASVHAFAQSSIGAYFVWFLVLVVAFATTLVLYRWPELRGYDPRPELRRAAVIAGWIILVCCGPGIFFLVTRAKLPAAIQFPALAVLAGGAVYVAVELVYRRMTRGMHLKLRRVGMESIWSREFTFLLNNWALLGFLAFVLVATTFPMISEALWDEKVTVGPPYYNAWVQPIGLVIMILMGTGTLFGWRKTSPEALRRAFRAPLIAAAVALAAHFTFGRMIGFPAVVWGDAIYPGALGTVLRGFNAYTPVMGVTVVAFNLAVVVQEFVALFAARRKSGASKSVAPVLWYAGFLPGFVYTMLTLPPASRRRYGGYVVHLGIIVMFLGFTGKSWTIDKETTLAVGQSYVVPALNGHERFTLEYVGERMEVDNNKRMVFADIRVTSEGKPLGELHPAKFIYKKMPESPTTEVSMMHSVRDDLYLVVGVVNPQTKMASLQIHVNPLVAWVWFGCVILIFGSFVCMWPELVPNESRVWRIARGSAAIATSIVVGVLIAMLPSPAFAQNTAPAAAPEGPTQTAAQAAASSSMSDGESMHGVVRIDNETERAIFSKLRCQCGCPTDLLSTCSCSSFAEPARNRIRAQLASGMKPDDIINAYVAEYGTGSIAVPANRGSTRLIYAVPLAAIVGGGAGLALLLKRWRKKEDGDGGGSGSSGPTGSSAGGKGDDYDARLDAELDDLDG
jgi:cytochrome c-type biogenesis protein CcmF